ncbi:hypothetical protein FRB95_006723 [Tulasnella sp. JGI-2019a]|nr:hypothetical protein FRB95_006723 [Tulasnella sp. JGI-2019a]
MDASASDEDLSGGIRATGMSSPIKQNRCERNNRDIVVGAPDACDEERTSNEETPFLSTCTYQTKAELQGHDLWTLFLAAGLLLLLLCRLLCSIFITALALLRLFACQKKRRQHGSGTGPSDEVASDLATKNTESSLQEALGAGQDAFDQFLASQRDEDLDDSIKSWQNVLVLCPIGHGIRQSILKNLGKSLQARFDRRGDMDDLEDRICHQQAALSLWPMDHPVCPSSLINLGNSFRARFNRQGDMGDLDESIRHFREAISLLPIGHADYPDSLNILGDALRIRFDHKGVMIDLEESTRLRQEALSGLATGYAGRPDSLNNINSELPLSSDKGTAPMVKPKLKGSPDEETPSESSTGTRANMHSNAPGGSATDKQVNYPLLNLTHLQTIEGNIQDGSGASINHEASSNSATLNAFRIMETWKPGRGVAEQTTTLQREEDLDGGIQTLENALAISPNNLYMLGLLGIFLLVRFDQRSDLDDLEKCIHYLQKSLSLHPISRSDSLILNSLGTGLGSRFERTGNMVDLEKCIHYLQEALSLHPIGHPNRSSILNNLGTALNKRFDRTGNVTDLEECIRHHQEALALRPVDHLDCASILSNLGAGLGARFKRTGNMADLEESIRHHQEALNLCPIGHPDSSLILSNLGVGLNTRFGKTGNMEDLEESIRHLQGALTLAPSSHPYHVSTLNSLGSGLSSRFDREGDVVDLEKSILYYQEALALSPIGHPNRASSLNNLGNGLERRFLRTGDMADLEECIRRHQEALTLRPIGHPCHASTLNNLSNGLDARFTWTDNVADLKACIRQHQEALTLRPIGHPDRASTLNNLGNGFNRQFNQTNDIIDLEKSILYYQEALALNPIGHPYRESALNNLGSGLSKRFDRTGDIDDLEESILCHQESLALCPIGHPGRAVALNSLSHGLILRFDRMGKMADLEESISCNQEALTLCPIGYPGRPLTLVNLGNGLRVRFDRSGDRADLEESIQHFKGVAVQKAGELYVRLTAANNWIAMARQNGLESLENAYSAFMNILDGSLLLAASNFPDIHAYMVRTHRDRMSVTEDATSHAIKEHRLNAAVEIAERGRALLFTHLGNYRTPLDDLEVLNKGLADRFRTLSIALDRSATSVPDMMTTLPASGDQVARHQQVVADWDHTIKEIRQLDGFGNFLDVTPFANLQQAAADGPIILVNISHDGSYALIITATREPLPVPLPEASPHAALVLVTALVECTRRDTDGPKSDQRLMEVLRDLWAMIVAPIVLQLEAILGLPAGSHIWWMPTSWAWWLPLHAAGPYKSSEKNLSDRFLSSYTTTLSSLIRSRADYQPARRVSGPKMLVVAQAEAEGHDPLPNVEAEVTIVRQLGTDVTVIEGEDCIKDSVLAGLKDTAWAHLSCHGHQNMEEPFKSHFSLRTPDTPLTLLDIIKNGLPQAELAVLSACHSASGNLSMPNETISLAAGMLFAGFRSAVGTMWAMDDQDGPIMAEHFYKYMFRNGPGAVDCRDAAKALVMGTRELRRRKVPLERWINFVHYGI